MIYLIANKQFSWVQINLWLLYTVSIAMTIIILNYNIIYGDSLLGDTFNFSLKNAGPGIKQNWVSVT